MLWPIGPKKFEHPYKRFRLPTRIVMKSKMKVEDFIIII